jgi:hypothetical protein
MCPQCFARLHWMHAQPGSPPCPKCGHEHSNGLSAEDYELARTNFERARCIGCGSDLTAEARPANQLCSACVNGMSDLSLNKNPRSRALDTDALGAGTNSDDETTHTITVDYGYDVHSIVVGHDTFGKIRSGQAVSIDGQGFLYEAEGLLIDHWSFDLAASAVRFTLDNGAEFEGRTVDLGEGRPAINLMFGPDAGWHTLLSRYAYAGGKDHLCARKTPAGLELAVCGHSWIAEVPSDWFDDDGEPIPEHRAVDGGLELPSSWDGETVTGIEDGIFVGELVADDERTIAVDPTSAENLAQALADLSWDETALEDLRTALECWRTQRLDGKRL